MPRIYDCIVVNDELDLLEARMEALSGVPGLVHIVCESAVTTDGEPKPLHFQLERYNRFMRFHGRWNHVIAEPHEITGDTPQEREQCLHSFLLHGFHGDPENDVILYGNLAEIPDAGYIRELAAGT
jgi:hypothetical protein